MCICSDISLLQLLERSGFFTIKIVGPLLKEICKFTVRLEKTREEFEVCCFIDEKFVHIFQPFCNIYIFFVVDMNYWCCNRRIYQVLAAVNAPVSNKLSYHSLVPVHLLFLYVYWKHYFIIIFKIFLWKSQR